ncbi:putative histone acetyltransferase subunit [Ascobolus immersus RN42]|uniref:Protein AF-9 homolog n=1 Tax=Ascobolus immersus RN42 TaxID=1160509 RepID=A0A3N4IQ21_ASCIM|nr:putative histone acetyltransferase subunit [Ascobolus immersus RN42]
MAPSGIKRVKGISAFRPIVYGTVARRVPPEERGPNFPPDHTHRWTVFVKGIHGRDISHFVKKVQFKLHETYANRIRNVEAPPFQVTETGWGEFEIQIKVYFVPEAGEKPLTLFHFLKIRPYNPEMPIEDPANPPPETSEPVYSQQYDEIIFNEPTEAFLEILKTKGDVTLPSVGKANARADPAEPFNKETEEDEVNRINLAIKKVNEVLEEKRKLIVQKEQELAELRKKRLEKEEQEKGSKMEVDES